jgi:hypothetical protein
MPKHSLYAIAVAILSTVPAAADVWDVQTDSDDSRIGTDNELVHGAVQVHDLGVRPGPASDEDWFIVQQKPLASYEVLVDGTTGDLDGFDFKRLLGDGATEVQTAIPVLTTSFGYSRTLRWANTESSASTAYVRLKNAACSTSCGSDDQYTIRFRETTIRVARFNATGSQQTVLLTQNATDRPVNFRAYFWSSSGALIATLGNFIPPDGLYIFSTAPVLSGFSGHITIVHDGGYGALNAKAVALEPATGFSFDTPGVSIPY